jgi:membrane protein
VDLSHTLRLPHDFGWRTLWSLCKDAVMAWRDDHARSLGAALSYYTLFSIGPLLLIVISIAGLAFGDEAARGQIFATLNDFVGDEGAAAVEGLVESVSIGEKSGVGLAVGGVLLLFGATRVFIELQEALERIWELPVTKDGGGWALVRQRILSFGMVLAIGFLLMVSLIANAALSALGRWWAPVFGGWEVALQAVNFALGLVLTTTMFALIYKLMPRVRIAWRDVWVGALVTAVLFSIGKLFIGLYIGKSGVASGFGAAASVVALLVWVYWSAQIFLIGAEFTWVWAHRFGSRRGMASSGPSVDEGRMNEKQR